MHCASIFFVLLKEPMIQTHESKLVRLQTLMSVRPNGKSKSQQWNWCSWLLILKLSNMLLCLDTIISAIIQNKKPTRDCLQAPQSKHAITIETKLGTSLEFRKIQLSYSSTHLCQCCNDYQGSCEAIPLKIHFIDLLPMARKMFLEKAINTQLRTVLDNKYIFHLRLGSCNYCTLCSVYVVILKFDGWLNIEMVRVAKIEMDGQMAKVEIRVLSQGSGYRPIAARFQLPQQSSWYEFRHCQRPQNVRHKQ